MRLRLTSVRYEADQIVSLEFADPTGAPLPPWGPGAHLEIRLPSGLIRHYSLCGDPARADRYRVAVLRVAAGRGGSREIHDTLRVGTVLEVSAPRDTFALAEADHHLLIAGGIGVTPILTMAEHLAARGHPSWRLVYGGRSRDAMAFGDRVARLPEGRAEVVCQDERGLPDLETAVAELPDGAHVYCCGPAPMIENATGLCARRPDLVLHTERFAAAPARPAATEDGAFEVELAESGQVLKVPADRSVLDVVREVLPDVAYSCESGFCGTCETGLVSGAAEHRDDLLTEAERDAQRSMMICVSRARPGERLVLRL
ncbi:PDR/VanB family oxidoreductase [Streptomyces tagetis]|uniref:Oxidoreductase n=1 Tax=Streptomyces tagetis TaxID=2820809 RepID=A0A940XJP3_9ACTN|nr:PDR/VanB family oxidoreductase [Streptomyces sp. RG38]MBQ0825875.1 oxidoreductase [Streptomyces sp. RG38]